jgi:GNAT superfamily N-acetyltransferase
MSEMKVNQEGTVYPPGYPEGVEHDVICDPGMRCHLRPIRPDDAARLTEFHSRLAPRSVFLRFFTFHPELAAKEAEHFACVDYVDRFALVAELDGRLIAVARFDRQSGDTEAEVAFVVSDEFQHHGIGSLLLDELATAARARGVTTFRAETLAENRAMLDVFRHAGFPVSSNVEYGTVTLRFPIEEIDTYRASLAERESRRAGGESPAPSATARAQDVHL